MNRDLCEEARLCFIIGMHTNVTSIHGIVPPRTRRGGSGEWSNVGSTLILSDMIDGGDLLKAMSTTKGKFSGLLYRPQSDGQHVSPLAEVTGRLRSCISRFASSASEQRTGSVKVFEAAS